MFNLASKLIKSVISTLSVSRQQELDRFISSRRPATPADVDRLIKEYDRKQSSSGWVI